MEKYEFVKDIGSGCFGVAKLMKNKETKELVAVKYIDRGLKLNQNVAREIINHRSLCHPNIIQFREVVLTPTHLAIVMEYAAGGELFERVSIAGRLSEDEARYFFQQLISGLSHCHSMQICHRDVKLENTLLDWTSRSPRLKLCDFGYSKSLHSRTKSTVGTPYYIAPEVLSGKEYDGKLADVWSCGVSLYAMVVGDYPFQDECDPKNLREALKRIKAVQYEIPCYVHISEECRDLLSRIFVADPARRINLENIKKHPWFLKNLPRELIDAAQTRKQNSILNLQSVEEIMKIMQEAKNIPPQVSRSVGGFGGATGKVEEGDLKKTSMKRESNKQNIRPRRFDVSKVIRQVSV